MDYLEDSQIIVTFWRLIYFKECRRLPIIVAWKVSRLNLEQSINVWKQSTEGPPYRLYFVLFENGMCWIIAKTWPLQPVRQTNQVSEAASDAILMRNYLPAESAMSLLPFTYNAICRPTQAKLETCQHFRHCSKASCNYGYVISVTDNGRIVEA